VDRIWTVVVFPAPFGAEQREDRSLDDVQVYPVENGVIPVRLAQLGHINREWPEQCHGCLDSWVSRCVSTTVAEDADRSLSAR
jgi:hypothetical protein